MTWNKELSINKIVQFLYAGGTTSILLYLTLHMKQLGITVTEISTIYAILYVASIIGPPISGIMADKLGNYTWVVFISMILNIIFHVSLLYVPERPRNPLTLSCGPHGYALNRASCDTCHELANTNLKVTLQNCEFDCARHPPLMQFCFHSEDNGICQSFNLTDQITINGTIESWQDGDRCGHTWQMLEYEGEVYEHFSCCGCPIRCQVPEELRCVHPDDEHASKTFWIYLVLRTIATMSMNSLFTMMDALTVAIVKQHGGEYGKQRLWFIVGMAAIPPLAGYVVDRYAVAVGYFDYMPVFYLGAGMTFLSGLLIIRKDVKVDRANQNILQDLKKLFTKVEINMFLLIILLMGSNWGFLESFLFIYLKELNAPNYLMGLTLTVGSIIGVPVTFTADQIVKKLGCPTIFIISFFAYAIRHFGYSCISDPWMVFPFELLEVFTHQLMWVATMTFCPLITPKGLLATMVSLVGTVHFSIGQGVGSLVGGHLIAGLGMPAAFRTFSAIALSAGLFYVIFHFSYTKKKLAARELEDERQQVSEEDRSVFDCDEQTPTSVMHKNSRE
ncbi:major facilitator superfamily domain-containing protein 6-like [Panulirus ornatus]|uniref:major facilitator superfamily domain-containing protein 6-like n=1 Tax=Panulirus ornatus TaxID=150431 RepID=UPI003A876C97